jgi:pSer/pThr/pTyr-binding forkhead associated (FHA) protein
MASGRIQSTAPARRPARDIIDAVVENMRSNLEELKYSTLAASRYTVYLHPNEYARLEGIVPILREQTVRALTEELNQLNRASRVRRWINRSVGRHDPEVQNAGADWQINFVADPDGDMAEGDMLVDSELMLPAQPDLGIGERTRRVSTSLRADASAWQATSVTTTRDATSDVVKTTAAVSAAAAPPVPATITYDDDRGHHSYDVVKDSFTIGRGGTAYPVDIRIASSSDVSREHARIRRDPATGQFFLIDLSTLGTTLNGRQVPRGYDDAQVSKRENGAETALPDAARIGLAETVFLEFRKLG